LPPSLARLHLARDWWFQRDGKAFAVPVSGDLSFDHAECLVEAACAGTAVLQISSYVTGDALHKRRLQQILTGFQIQSPGMWVMYPQNRHLTPRVRVFVDFLVEAANAGTFSGKARRPARTADSRPAR
jgi:DNA-binding transcriptional LysR family regulator